MANVVLLFKPSAKVPFLFLDSHLEQICAACDGKVFRFETEEELLQSGIQAEILFTWGGTGEMPVTYCFQNKQLKWLHSFSAGMDPVLSSEIASLPILITNSSGIHSPIIAESVMGYILAWNRTLPFMLKKQQEHVWAKGMARDPVEAFSRTVGIVGAGAIGQAVAKCAKAFGMYTIGLRRNPAPMPNFDEVLVNTSLENLLSRSDYVVLSTPLSPETYHMIGELELKQMKPEAVLINVARGGVVNQEALIRALKDGTIAGAALDVTDPEPLPPDSELWDMENVMITPHMCADAPILSQLAVDFFCENIRLYLAGEPVLNQISH